MMLDPIVFDDLQALQKAAKAIEETAEKAVESGYFNSSSFRAKVDSEIKKTLAAYMAIVTETEDSRVSNLRPGSIVALRSNHETFALHCNYLHTWQATGHRSSYLAPTICEETRQHFSGSTFRTDPPYDLIYLCVYAPDTPSSKITDHDNLDLKSVCDAVSQCLGIDDNGVNMGVVCRSILSDDIAPGYYVLLVSRAQNDAVPGTQTLLTRLKELGFT